jgi:hypothetical protein
LACTHEDVESCQQVLEDVKKMILDVLVKKQEASKRKKKETFQYIGKNDEDKGKEISLISKEASFISFVFRD